MEIYVNKDILSFYFSQRHNMKILENESQNICKIRLHSKVLTFSDLDDIQIKCVFTIRSIKIIARRMFLDIPYVIQLMFIPFLQASFRLLFCLQTYYVYLYVQWQIDAFKDGLYEFFCSLFCQIANKFAAMLLRSYSVIL